MKGSPKNTNWEVEDRQREARMRLRYVELQPGDQVEIIHYMKIGFRHYQSKTIGTVVSKDRRECGTDGGWRRNWDDRYWFDHLVVQKSDGELTTLTIDEYTEIRNLTQDTTDS